MARTFVCPNCASKFTASTKQIHIAVSCPACGSRCYTPSALEDTSIEIVHLHPDSPNPDVLHFALACLSEWNGGLIDRAGSLDCLGNALRGLSLAERAALAAKLLDPHGISTSAEIYGPVQESRAADEDAGPRGGGTSERETRIDP